MLNDRKFCCEHLYSELSVSQTDLMESVDGECCTELLGFVLDSINRLVCRSQKTITTFRRLDR
jgi:hypothetical protein